MRSFVALRILLGVGACVVAIVATPVSADSGSLTPAAPDVGTSKPEDLFSIFAGAPPIQPAQYEIKDLEKVYPDFQHQPFEQAGFNAVMLPFSYYDPNHAGDANEALALDALISYDLDWSPGCYCTRHAFYVFQHDRVRIQAIQRGYSPEQISSLIKSWRATQAIGGEVTRTPGGYEGKLEIFAADGKRIFTRNYDRSRSFWDLLGDMDVDAMAFLDVKPSGELADYLHQPRCKQPQSLIDLGSTAFMTESSPGAFDVYKKILEADPVFAMVRTWYANQKYVHDRDFRSEAAQLGIALSSRIDAAALENFIPKYCPDQELASQYQYWLNTAAGMASEDSPLIIECRLGRGYYGSQNLQSVVDRGLKTAEKYPNSHFLVRDVAESADDAWMSASLLTSSLLDRYLTGFSDKALLTVRLANFCGVTGHDDIAMELLSAEGAHPPQNNLYMLLRSLSRGGRYAEAADFYQLLGPTFDPTTSKWMAPYGALCGIRGRRDGPDAVGRQNSEGSTPDPRPGKPR
jgi:hypothetical protein